MTNQRSFYWHDYETFGADPRRDRPAQFAGLRTDWDLRETGDPLTLYCAPADDVLPHPDACLITGITPQLAAEKGVTEHRFIRAVHDELARPGTCGVGYNSIRFDDEVTRHTLYRNFYDPYAREWQHGNSRWDLIDVARMTAALRPDGVHWPLHADGTPSFRLEDLTRANGIEHGQAHDALADVRATIALARLLRGAQPRLFEFALGLRAKQAVAEQIDVARMQPFIHVSSRYPASQGCLAVVAPLALHPRISNRVVVVDLSVDPQPLLELPPDEIARRVFTSQAELGATVERIPLKEIHYNRSPMVAPLTTLRPADADRLGIDLDRCHKHLERIAANHPAAKLAEIYGSEAYAASADPDIALYDRFVPDSDRNRLPALRRLDGARLIAGGMVFDDPRLNGLLPRYIARNFPDQLSGEWQNRWTEFRRWKLSDAGSGYFGLAAFDARMRELRSDPERAAAHQALFDQLQAWRDQIAATL